MAAEFESGFFVREKAWHGLGTVVQDAPTSADALRLAGLDWNVSQRPVFTDIGDRHVQIPNYVANVRDTDNKVLGLVTERYKIVQNVEALDFTDNLIGGDVHYETAGSLRGGKTIWLLAQMPTTKILGDDVEPYICFTNSHDGFGAIKVCMTPVRVVCNNTLNLALTTAKRSWSTKHVGNIDAKLEEARHTLNLANTYMDELAKKADELANTPVTDEQIATVLNDMFPVATEDSDRKRKTINDIKDNYMVCYFQPDIAKFIGTAWGAVNAMADMADHAAPKRMTSSYQENNWNNIMNGHVYVDTMLLKLLAAKTA